jgi:ribonucleoside-diphosphate reductase beta chain
MKVNTDYKNRKMFLDGESSIARFDVMTYPMIDKFTETQMSFYWRPEEIQDIIRDKNDFASLSKHEQHIFSSNLLRQILLDSIQGSAPSEILGPCASTPEVSNWIQAWTFSETVHSRSYTHIIRNIYPNPDKIFDMIPQIKEIVDCAVDISKYYDDLDSYNKMVSLFGYNGVLKTEDDKNFNLYDHKKLLYKCLMSVNILEGIRFYGSFVCSWAFAERNKMEGNAKIIKLIAKDENLHLASTQYMLKQLRKSDPEFEKIHNECMDEVKFMFQSAIDQEKAWAHYLFKDGSMLGLTEPILCQYVDYIAKQRMKAVDIPSDHIEITQNPLPWSLKWISGKEVQNANQEVSQTGYLVGAIKADLDMNKMSKFKL